MRHVPLVRDINIAINGCSGFATSTQKGPFTAMLISCSRGTYLIMLSLFLLDPISKVKPVVLIPVPTLLVASKSGLQLKKILESFSS